MTVFISKSSPTKNIIYAKRPPHRVILSGANDSVNRLRSRTRRKEGDANGIRISVSTNESVSPEIPPYGAVPTRGSTTQKSHCDFCSAQDDTLRCGRGLILWKDSYKSYYVYFIFFNRLKAQGFPWAFTMIHMPYFSILFLRSKIFLTFEQNQK